MSRIKIPPELLQKIKESVNIIDIVGEHVVLRKSGANHSGLCPFHSERTPSFSVHEAKQLYFCHGCKAGGDVVSFVMEIHGLDFAEAIQELADRAGINIPNIEGSDGLVETGEKGAGRERTALAYKLNRFAAAFYRQCLPNEREAFSYIKKRGMNEDIERSFYVGAAPVGWDALSKKLISSKAPLDLAVQLGLIRPSPKGTSQGGCGYFDLFRGRVLFPILDTRGKVVGMGGRLIPGIAEVQDGPKYMNSPESFIYHKGKLAFALYQARKHVREMDNVIFVEGFFDVLAMHAAGFRNVVASCGTALTTDHLALFKKIAGRITVLFDSDRAGRDATERAMELGLEAGVIIYGVNLPEGKDPDEFLIRDGGVREENRERMQAILNNAVPLLDSRIKEELVDFSKDPETRTNALKKIAFWLSKFSDPVGRAVRVDGLQSRGISRELLTKALKANPQVSNSSRPAEVIQLPPVEKFEQLNQREKLLLRSLANWDDFSKIWESIREDFPEGMDFSDLFEHQVAKSFTRLFFERAFSAGNAVKRLEGLKELLLRHVPDPQVRSIITEAMLSERSEISPIDVQVALKRSLGRIWVQISQRLKAALADAESRQDVELEAKLKRQYLEAERKKNALTMAEK